MFGLFEDKIQKLTMKEAEKSLSEDNTIILLDVRTPQEYASGHLPGSISIPLDQINSVQEQYPAPETKLFVYCLSGGRSAMACHELARMGYEDVTNIGGITSWNGDLEQE